MPNLPITVDYDFYEAVRAVTSTAFADSYLSGAELHQNRLLPRTQMAWTRLKENWASMNVMRKMQIVMLKPPPYSDDSNVQLNRAA